MTGDNIAGGSSVSTAGRKIQMGRITHIEEQSRTLWFSATYIDGKGKEYDLCIRKDYYELSGVVESKVVSIEWFGVEILPYKKMQRDIEAAAITAEQAAAALALPLPQAAEAMRSAPEKALGDQAQEHTNETSASDEADPPATDSATD